MDFSGFETFIEGSYDYEEAIERQGLRREDVDLLRQKIKRSKLVPRFIHDKLLLLFINAAKDDVDKSAKWIHLYYKMKRNAPEFFSNRDVLSDEVQHALDNQIFLAMPTTPDNCSTLLHKLRNIDPKTYDFDGSTKTFCMMAEAHIFLDGPRDGTNIIYDLKGGGFRHLLRPSISSIRKGIEFMQVGSPLNVKAIHVFNASYLMDFIFSMVRPFLRKELFERIHLHPPGMDYNEFFKKYIPKSHMPSDYGGDLASCDELHEQNRKLMMSLRKYYLSEEEQMNLKLEERASDNGDDEFFDAE